MLLRYIWPHTANKVLCKIITINNLNVRDKVLENSKIINNQEKESYTGICNFPRTRQFTTQKVLRKKSVIKVRSFAILKILKQEMKILSIRKKSHIKNIFSCLTTLEYLDIISVYQTFFF